MTFEVQSGRLRRTIEVRRSGSGWAVTVDGRQMAADLVPVGARWSMLLREVDSGSSPSGASDRVWQATASHEIGFERQGSGRQLVSVDGRRTVVTILDPRQRVARGRDSSAPDATGPFTVVSPMPGRVVKVLVAPGDEVNAGQGLVVIEAMKMENEFRAPRAGKVTEVRVHEGAAVEANTILVTLS